MIESCGVTPACRKGADKRMKIDRIACLCFIAWLSACSGKDLLSGKVEYLSISTRLGASLGEKKVVKTQTVIDEIVKVINLSHSEPVKFLPDYKIEIKYQNEIKQVFVRGRYIKLDGRTYCSSEDLGAKIKSILES
jgi:hypothetical protein